MKYYIPMYLVYLTLLPIAVSAESQPVKSQSESSHGSASVVTLAEQQYQADKCKQVSRRPSYSSYHGCGVCLSGFTEDVNKICTADCSPNLNCDKDKRESCTPKTGGKCGPCKLPYIQIYNRCMSEPVVNHLIQTMESYIAHMPHDVTPVDVTPNDVTPDDVTPDDVTPHSPRVEDNNRVIPQASPSNQGTNTASDLQKRMPSAVSNEQGQSVDPRVKVNEAQRGSAETPVGFNNLIFFGVVSGATLLCVVCLIIAGVCWYRFYKIRKSMKPADYVGYGGGYGGGKEHPSKDMNRSDSSGDRKLAQSAQMYHYQQVKQQMLALEKSGNGKLDESDVDDVEENEDGNYKVYECPGLAPAGEMEVSNPLFQAGGKTSPSSTPSSPPSSPPQISPPQQKSGSDQ